MQNNSALIYNTDRPKMQIPEYGRNVQKMVDYAVSLPTKEERNKVANAIIKVMGELNPHLRDVEEYKPKLWTHLFIMSDFQLDVDSPYPIPEKEKLSGKPNKVDYPQSKIKIGHYGKTVEKMIDKAIEMPKGDERDALEKYIAVLMKRFYLSFNDTSVEDEVIIDHLAKLSDGKIQLFDTSFLPGTNDILKAQGLKKSNNNKGGSRNNNKNKNRNKNRKRHQ
ncbi:DUF4290 domain-containing protein [Paracrocinitomix mangrovi]|uniref:DUF4290 domain-containing protein n=1 Tax=Paracrocinitomix mangrovi TaxID=2862509 RepID=UPI001C8EE536|nr:DUF4290 domain-containing protein [Paracrocinitomix mangrovi]UKN03863.1 DUF4290 domain-containing protein [Paracrocinitomix mangrovi]